MASERSISSLHTCEYVFAHVCERPKAVTRQEMGHLPPLCDSPVQWWYSVIPCFLLEPDRIAMCLCSVFEAAEWQFCDLARTDSGFALFSAGLGLHCCRKAAAAPGTLRDIHVQRDSTLEMGSSALGKPEFCIS